MSHSIFYAFIDYEDQYVQPLIVSALKSHLHCTAYKLIHLLDECPKEAPLLQIRSYESIDFALGLSTSDSLFNAYIIRKALIRKHYLSSTISAWVIKHPMSTLKYHFKPAVDFELDYAEFLDDALLEVFELHEAFARNAEKNPSEREWWILKPGMSDRGQGIRLFSTEDELRAIFEGWEADNPDSDLEDNEQNPHLLDSTQDALSDHIKTSHLRHFIAQPYIHPPLLIPSAPYNNRKFHIRTYVVAAGALQVYVYTPMLALFASSPYAPPWDTQPITPPDTENAKASDVATALHRFRNIHLTNTCAQNPSSNPNPNPTTINSTTTPTTPTNPTTSPSPTPPNKPSSSSSIHLLSTLPLPPHQQTSLLTQIRTTTSTLFLAALAHPTNFQPLPQSFEIFGLDFLVSPTTSGPGPGPGFDCDRDCAAQDHGLTAWLLEVNAFPDFAQTGADLRDVVVKGLFEEVVGCVVAPHFGIAATGNAKGREGSKRLVKVLDVDLGRR